MHSRGFTLEGLTVSYFLRNSMMYDTLLQMGRWFGYRDGYADVCRIFMTEEAIDWYAHISDAIDELRDEFKPAAQARSSLWKRSPAGVDYIAVSGKALRVGGRGQVKAGMSIEEINAAEKSWDKTSDIPDRHYIKHRIRPLLMLHVLDVWNKEKDKEKVNPPAAPSVIAWGIAFPKSGYETTEVTYVVNTTWWAENYGTTEDDADED